MGHEFIVKGATGPPHLAGADMPDVNRQGVEMKVFKDSRKEENEKQKVVYVFRHGQSVNNILSQERSPFAWKREKEKMANEIRGKGDADTVLSTEGMAQANRTGFLMTGGDGDEDHVGIFSPDFLPEEKLEAIYVSPLRRAIATALLMFWKPALQHNIPMKVHWALSERRMSASDDGSESEYLMAHVSDILAREDFGLLTWAQKKFERGVISKWLEPLTQSIFELESNHRGSMYSSEACVLKGGCKWWPEVDDSGLFSSEKPADYCWRIKESTEFIANVPEKTVAVVGHSNFFRDFLDPFGREWKMNNAAGLRAVLTTTGSGSHEFESVRRIPLFLHVGSSLRPVEVRKRQIFMDDWQRELLKNLDAAEKHRKKSPKQGEKKGSGFKNIMRGLLDFDEDSDSDSDDKKMNHFHSHSINQQFANDTTIRETFGEVQSAKVEEMISNGDFCPINHPEWDHNLKGCKFYMYIPHVCLPGVHRPTDMFGQTKKTADCRQLFQF
uniref:Uncharacterized protein n=1 Tax=Chromera velia CCMP2878 TaxID=1169474 RepID=A0A0G4IEB8_9ALVE|eukprot:Cvel_13666.t1-p1 / transcript=Cvel_13666.t1 / gene=Cvel_13666 / organism=Chromera_velia_CCMP2878 / gene_product=hypothetical protein / transcript_product=hypothetical protein / location=Cvel_scaffold943:39197-40690(-) / protein_length=498 / sequence_SO=supercontig / SO=protein_coding / is_pseudo=false